MPRLSTPIPALGTATQFDLIQISLHDIPQRVSATIELQNDAGQVVRTVCRSFTYADLAMTPGTTLTQLRALVLAQLRTLQDIN